MRMLFVISLIVLISSCSVREEVKDEKPPVLEISVAFWDIEKSFNRENDDYLKFLEDKFRVRIIPHDLSWGDFNQKILYWAASNKLPDIFVGSFMLSDEYYDWIDKQKIRPLPDNLDSYPHIKKITSQEGIRNLKVDGKLYLFPRINAPDATYNSAERGIISRKDWRENLGLDIPETFEDYLNLARAFKELDADGNGIDDTTAITFSNKNYTSTVFLSSVPEAASKTWKFEDNRWIPGYTSKDMITGIMELNRLWNEGLLDPNLLSLSGKQGDNNFCLGKTGMLFTQIKPRVIYTMNRKWKHYNDTELSDVVEFLPIWRNEQGERYSFHEGKNFWSSSYFSSEISDLKMDRILQIYDYLLSEEGQTSLKYGIPGKDFVLENGTLKRMDTSIISDKYPSLIFLIDLASWGGDMSNWVEDEYSLNIYEKDIMDMCMSIYKKNIDNLSPVNMKIQYLNTPTKARFEKGDAIFDTVLSTALSDNPEEEWKRYMDLLREDGLEMAIEEVNKEVME